VIAAKLLGSENRLQAIAAASVPKSGRDAGGQGSLRRGDRTSWGTIEVVVSDDIRPAFQRLERASRVTDEDLRSGSA
jgi:hypothetical protein